MGSVKECRFCHQKIDIEADRNWIVPGGKGWYYHIQCYDDWVKRKNDRILTENYSADEWLDLVKDYLWRDIKLPNINWSKIIKQWKSFLSKDYKAKGMYLTLLYMYEVEHCDKEAAQGGIGLIPFKYEEAGAYWYNMEQKRQGAVEGIIKQMAAQAERPVLKIKDTARRNSPRPKFTLDDIGDDEDDG